MSLLATIAAVALGRPQLNPDVFVWRSYKEGSYSAAKDQRIIVMDTLAAYQQYCNTYAPEGAGDSRDVDWTKEELIAIHIGPRSTGGYSVGVTTIKKTQAGQATVYWAEFTPVRGLEVSKQQTSPWQIIRLNRPGYRLNFEGHKEEGRLPGGIKIYNLGTDDGGPCTCCDACIRRYQRRLPFTNIACGDDATPVTPSTCVMSSMDEYTRYLQSYNMTGLPSSPNIDWYHQRLLAIHLGHKFTDGYRILIDHVDIIDNRRVDVSYVEVQPTGRLRTSFSTTGPYLLVEIPRVGSMVTFTKRSILDTQPLSLDSCNCGCDGCRHCGHKG